MILFLKSIDEPVVEDYENYLNSFEKNIELSLVYYNDAQKLEFESKSTQIIEKGKAILPSWIKNNAKWWSEGSIDDSDFINGIQHMIQEKIIDIPNMPEQAYRFAYTSEDKIPKWIKNHAEWWAKGLISEDEFLASIEYLVSNGIIQTK